MVCCIKSWTKCINQNYLCRTHFLWTKAKPCNVIWRYDFISAGDRTIFLSLITASRSLSMNWNTKCKFPLCGNASINSIIFGSFNSFSSLISRKAVKLIPSFWLPSRIFLMATVCPVWKISKFCGRIQLRFILVNRFKLQNLNDISKLLNRLEIFELEL